MATSRYSAQNSSSLLDLDFSDANQVCQFVDGLWQSREGIKNDLEREWLQNIAWFAGEQNLIWDEYYRSLYEPNIPPWRVRLIVNLLQPQIRNLISKSFRTKPEWDVLPATSDITDIQIAQLNKQILDYEWVKLQMTLKHLDALSWAFLTGNCFLKICWDPDKGVPLNIPDNINISPRVQKYVDDLYVGDTEINVVPPFEVIVDPLALSIQDASWVLYSKIVDVADIQEQFPNAKPIADANAVTISAHFDFINKLRRITNRGSSFTSYWQRGQAILHELWIKPRGKSKNGLTKGKFIVMCGGQILNGNGKGVDFPYKHKQLPFVHLKEIHVPGQFWGTSTCKQLKPLQSDYNRTKSQLVENRNLMSKPKWTSPKGAGIGENSLTSEPGEVIEYNYPYKPEPVQPPSMPAYVNNMLAEHRADMEDISGQHDASRAEAPGQVRSGRGIFALVEQDETRLGPVMTFNDEQLMLAGAQLLALNNQYVDEERIAKITGENDELLVFSYRGADLKGNNSGPGINYFDVRIKTTSELPKSRAAQQEILDGLLERGVLNPEKDRKLILSILGIGVTEKILDKSRIHRSKQFVENQALSSGQQPRVEQWHDHQTHLEVLDEYRNSAAFEQLPDEIKQLFDLHAEEHKLMMYRLMVEPEIRVRQATNILAAQMLGPQGVINGQGQNGTSQFGNAANSQRQQSNAEGG